MAKINLLNLKRPKFALACRLKWKHGPSKNDKVAVINHRGQWKLLIRELFYELKWGMRQRSSFFVRRRG
jgi:hypothetical protein